MFETVELAYWQFLLVAGFAAVTFASHFLFPSVRWFFRKRAERLLAHLNAKLDRPIELFKLARRQDMIVRLIYDPKVLEAVSENAAETGVPGAVAFEEAKAYAKEIVPGFSTTLYFGLAIRLARWVSQGLYRVKIGRVDGSIEQIQPNTTVIFVMNHRSNMDYLLVTWLVSRRTNLSFAVGEWARIWPLSRLVRAMGAYFIRRGSRNSLYRRVLARYVQMATAEGTTQAMFPEGGLSLNGRVGPAKLGLLSYIVGAYRPDGRDIIFVPVGLGYDRVLEDLLLIKADVDGVRRFRAKFSAVFLFVWRNLIRKLRGRFLGFGVAAVGFGKPVSLGEFYGKYPGADVEQLGRQLMHEITLSVPVTPVPLVAAALLQGPQTREDLQSKIDRLIAELTAGGASLRVPTDISNLFAQGLSPLINRGMVSADLRPTEKGAKVLEFYAAPVLQLLETDQPRP